jgi:putative ABC transport system permease protein
MRLLRNIFRRKLRAFLTIFGITVGVFALVAMGAMAEKLNLLVDGGIKFYKDKVSVTEGQIAGFAGNPMSVDKIKEVEKVEGVAKASAQIGMTLDEEISAVNMGPPASIGGTDLRGQELDTFETRIAEGRKLKPNDREKVVVGSDLVEKLNAKVGKDVTIRGKKFKVIGLLEKTLSTPDNTAQMSLYDAQLLYHKTLPPVVRAQVDPDKLATGLTVYIKKGYDPNKVAKAIDKEVDNITALGPKGFEEQVANSVKIFTSIIFGIALISLLVGGLSVINTMTMSVAERTREIGIRKAIGATDGHIVRQFLLESGVIGLIGGAIGLSLGWLFTIAANSAGAESATPLFLITTRLAIGSVFFALFLGVISGLYPAWHAARLNPVEALRYE